MIVLSYFLLSIVILGVWIFVAALKFDGWVEQTRERLHGNTGYYESNLASSSRIWVIFHIVWIGCALLFFWPVVLPCMLVFAFGRRLAKRS